MAGMTVNIRPFENRRRQKLIEQELGIENAKKIIANNPDITPQAAFEIIRGVASGQGLPSRVGTGRQTEQTAEGPLLEGQSLPLKVNAPEFRDVSSYRLTPQQEAKQYGTVSKTGEFVPLRGAPEPPTGARLVPEIVKQDHSSIFDEELKKARTDYYRGQAGDIPEKQEERIYKQRERRNTERTRIIDRFNADASVKKSQQMIDGASTIEELATSDNPIAAASIPTFMARASGEVGNLSEADKAPFGGSRAIAERLEAAAVQAANGRLTSDNRAFILQLAELMKKRGRDNQVNLAKIRARQYSSGSDFLSEKDILATLVPEINESPSQAEPQSGVYDADKEARYQEWKKKNGY